MQTNKLKPIYNLVNKEFMRSLSVASSAVKSNSDQPLKSWREIPGPSSLPIIGQLLHALPGGDIYKMREHDGGLKNLAKYGPIFRVDAMLGQSPMIFLSDAESAATILRNENWLPVRPGFVSLDHYRKQYKINNSAEAKTIPATGLLTDHGEIWKEFRSTVNPIMLQPKTIKIYCETLDEVALDMIARMKADRNANNMIQRPFDMEMNLWALESIGTVALGCRLNCLDPHLPQDCPEKDLIMCINEQFRTMNELDFSPGLWRYITTPSYRKAMKLYERHENLTKHFIRKGVEELKNSSKKSGNAKGVLEKLLELNEEFAYIMASDMLFAGVDTAANSLIGALYLLAKNPEKQKKLREEIITSPDKRPYLKACIKEAMRMFPVVSGNLRLTTKEYNILGYKIPKNINVIFAHHVMSMMDQYYPRPTEYIPERWITDKSDPLYYGNAHPFANAPFGFGARSCIGRRIAELEIETFLGRMIENFEVEWFGEPPKIDVSSINYFKEPYNFIFKDVSK